MNKSIMNAKDTVSAKLAECYVTVDGNRYNFMQAIKLEAKVEKTKTEVPILGKQARVISLPVGKVQARPHFTTTLQFSVNFSKDISERAKIFISILRLLMRTRLQA